MNFSPGLAAFPEQPGMDCSSCEDLWRGYRDAMIAHLHAIDELQMAQFMQNDRRSLYLEGVVLRAERKREEARGIALSHQDMHHVRMAA